MSRGTQSQQQPLGNGANEKEKKGNHQLQDQVKLATTQQNIGNFWSIELPSSSFACVTDALLSEMPGVRSIDLDQCMIGLRPPGVRRHIDSDVRVQKPTSILTNLPNAHLLNNTCDYKHQHEFAVGSCLIEGRRVRRAAYARIYPSALSWAMADLVADAAWSRHS